MSKATYNRLLLSAAAVLAASTGFEQGFGQAEIQLHLLQQPGWEPRAREGRGEVRVWAEYRAPQRPLGAENLVDYAAATVAGSRSFDDHQKPSDRQWLLSRVSLLKRKTRIGNHTERIQRFSQSVEYVP
jgi:hypothetical protein